MWCLDGMLGCGLENVEGLGRRADMRRWWWQEEWLIRQLERRSMKLDRESEPEVECSNGHWQRVSEVLSSAAIQEAIPCPACVAANTVPPFCFQRRNCMLYFEESNDAKIGALHCEKCNCS